MRKCKYTLPSVSSACLGLNARRFFPPAVLLPRLPRLPRRLLRLLDLRLLPARPERRLDLCAGI